MQEVTEEHAVIEQVKTVSLVSTLWGESTGTVDTLELLGHCGIGLSIRLCTLLQDPVLLNLVRRSPEGLNKLGRVPAETLARTSSGAA